MSEAQGDRGVSRSGSHVKGPSVDEARPAACDKCGQASRPAGGPLGMHGQGTRLRQTRGPATVEGDSVVGEVAVRRYRCTRCETTVTVAPSDVVRGRLYRASAIAVAFVLLGVRRLPQRAVRERLSAWRQWGEGSGSRWDALRDWVAAVRDGRLFRGVRRPPDDWPPWRVAERAATTVAALGPPDATPLETAAFAGAARAA